jgi:hypothetical protein
MSRGRKILVVFASLAIVLALGGGVGAKTYDFTNTPLLHKAYEGYCDSRPPSSLEVGTEMSSTEYTAISFSDDDRASYSKELQVEPWDQYEFHRFKFKISEPLSDIVQLYVRHEGYGDNQGQYGLHLYIWNYASSSWKDINYHSASGDSVLDKTYTSGFEDYIDTSGYLQLLAITQYNTSSCPYLYAWNGTGFEFIEEFNTPAALGCYDASVGKPYVPKTEDYVKIDGSQLEALDGAYRLEVANDQDEILYLDKVKLLVVEHPPQTEIYSTTMIKFAEPYPFKIHTIRDPRPPISAVDENGTDILPVISEMDRVYTEGEDFYWDTITLDFGDLSGAEQIKLLYSSYLDWPLAPGIAARYLTEEYRARVEVINEDGEWEEVSLEEPLGLPQAKQRTVVIDITNWFKTDDYRVRIHNWEKIPIDYIAVDTSEDEEVIVTELDLVSADLHWKGVAKEFSPDGKEPLIADYYTTVDASGFEPFIGNFTRYGDVLSLLTQVDDKFVIMHAGDAISLAFDEVPVLEGMERDYFLFSDAYYKQHFVRTLLGEEVSRVEPLPFHGMSFYPYPEEEGYPYDAEHLAYLEEYNTREVSASSSVESDHHTIYTDYVKVEITTPKNSSWTTVAPIVDGSFTQGEWTNAQLLIEDPIHTYVYFMNDNSFLYVCVDAANLFGGDYTEDDNDYCDLVFDTGHDELWEEGHEDWFRVYGDGRTEHNVATTSHTYIPHCTNWTLNHPGLEGVAGFGGSPNAAAPHRIYEFKIPLSLLKASPGDTIGFASPVGADSLPHDFSTGRHNIWPPGAEMDDLTTWGDLVLASPPSPVGGEAYPVSKISLLAPWIALAAAIIAGASIFMRRRRAES